MGPVTGSQTLIVMSRTYRATLPETTRVRICRLIRDKPGLKSREIASLIGIDRRELNRFLWYEGKVTRGLYVRNWRWYDSGAVQPLIPPQLQDPAGSGLTPSHTVCGVLSNMNELEAIRQIRRLDQVAIEKAFSEEEYSGLPDVLKIELVQRLEQLKKDAMQGRKSSASFHPLLSFGLLAAGMVLLVKLLALLSK
jgi:hypothetical protein